MNDLKWFWMMEYCKKKGLPPAQSWAWNQAKRALDKTLIWDLINKANSEGKRLVSLKRIVKNNDGYNDRV